MVELLADWKRIIIEVDGRQPTLADFQMAWDRSWEIMVIERAWPHATKHRRAWRQVQDETKAECCAAFLDTPSPFAFAARRIAEAAEGMCLRLAPEQLGKALLAAVAYVEAPDIEHAELASDAAAMFVAPAQYDCGYEREGHAPCRLRAGHGTDHLGYGWCRAHERKQYSADRFASIPSRTPEAMAL